MYEWGWPLDRTAGTSLALEFVADFVVSGRAAVGLILAARLLMHLAAPEQQPTRPGQALGAPRSAPPAGGLSPGGGTDREDRFVAVMMNIRLAGSMFPKALVMREILRLAQRAGFLQAQAQVSNALLLPRFSVWMPAHSEDCGANALLHQHEIGGVVLTSFVTCRYEYSCSLFGLRRQSRLSASNQRLPFHCFLLGDVQAQALLMPQ